MRESIKRTTDWAAHYYLKSYYPVPENTIKLKGMPFKKRLAPCSMSPEDCKLMRSWAEKHGKCMYATKVSVPDHSQAWSGYIIAKHVRNVIPNGREVQPNL